VTADKARQIAAQARAARDLRNYLLTIERSAKDGNYEQMFGGVNEQQAEQFKMLGYKVASRGPDAVVVSWSNLPLT
jgi:hypothetical protein